MTVPALPPEVEALMDMGPILKGEITSISFPQVAVAELGDHLHWRVLQLMRALRSHGISSEMRRDLLTHTYTLSIGKRSLPGPHGDNDGGSHDNHSALLPRQ